MSDKLQVKFKCDHCGITEGTAFVAPRTEGQDLEDWILEVAAPEVTVVHDQVSPGCKTPGITDVRFKVSKLGVGFLLTGEEDGTETI